MFLNIKNNNEQKNRAAKLFYALDISKSTKIH